MGAMTREPETESRARSRLFRAFWSGVGHKRRRSRHDSGVRPRVALIAVVAIVMLGPPSCTGGGGPLPSNVITSSVKQVVNVPRLIGLPVKDAQRRLADVGLKLGTVTVNTDVSSEAVIRRQQPSAGTAVSLGTAVNVLSGAAAVH